VNCLKNNIKIYIKISFKTAPTCFGAVTPSSDAITSNALPHDGVTAPKHVGVLVKLILM
jgi:hypothetical protein